MSLVIIPSVESNKNFSFFKTNPADTNKFAYDISLAFTFFIA